MRITLEMLNKVARDTVTQRTRSNRDILAVYMHGSLLTGDPLLGGTADVDLFFLHNDDIPDTREIVRMTDEVHLDIAHHSRRIYRQARDLRLHPWLGSTVYGCKILYDPQHVMDFIQASVRGQFTQPGNIMARSRSQAEAARQIWLSFQMDHPEPGIGESLHYLKAIEQAANAIASLNGGPLAERRFLLSFPERAEAVGHRGLYNGLMGLLGSPAVETEMLRSWVPQWRATFEAVPHEKAPPRLNAFRVNYYLRAFEAMLGSDAPMTVLWPMMNTWTQAARLINEESPEYTGWQKAAVQLGLLGEAFYERVTAFDAYLDQVEETLDAWAQKNGILEEE